MKKILLALAVASALTMPADAQVKFSIRGGLNIDKFELNSKIVEAENQTGFFVGPSLKIDLPLFDIEAAGIYDQRSIDVDGETINKKSVDLQVNIRKGINFGENAGVFAFIGPQVAFNVGAKDISEIPDNVKEWRWKESDFSINLGVGITILKHYEARVSYNVACGKSADAEEAIQDTFGDFNNLAPKANAWQVGVSYIF